MLFLCLVIIIIMTLCYEMTSLTAFKARALPFCLVLVGVLLTSFKCGLEALDDKRHFILIEPGSLHLCHLAR
jgi:CDP-diglyceride synthetase